MLTQEKVGEVRNLINGGTAFVNPFATTLPLVSGALTTAKGIIDTAPIGSALNLSAPQLILSIETLEDTLSDFGIHTDNLSGVNLSNGLNGANFATISQVVATVQKYQNDGSVCEVVFNAFGAIIQAAQIINSIRILIGQLENLENSTPANIINFIDNLETILRTQIEQDLIAFANAQISALRNAVANTLIGLGANECLSQIIGIVGGAELKKIVLPEIGDIV